MAGRCAASTPAQEDGLMGDKGPGSKSKNKKQKKPKKAAAAK
ncbi:MAG: hypothetical protein ABIW50_06120 [Candidatus Limnocylindria bacterium]